ncbi:hypothetical protein FOZ63_025502 [Perkinsus olseni]|uniref:Uncharacterized protein n=1 Tax=Perkinsus olseni TaxID=32597 RepID=A0A7J6NS88_PEROL|nr:hypothetical protein FOZ60_005932 [Perkinsus olseni]KAF4727726.1 hypothetical protein FOZ63_025502 [Perkinsus olseni]
MAGKKPSTDCASASLPMEKISIQCATHGEINRPTCVKRVCSLPQIGEKRRKPEWSYRHGVVFSWQNDLLNANLRSYFDRWRDPPDNSGQSHQPMFLKPSWTLSLPASSDDKMPEKLPSAILPRLDVDFERMAARNPTGPCGFMVPLTKGEKLRRKRRNESPRPKPGWLTQHHICFCKDNHLYHKNYREYFDVPKKLLW